jgi:integrase
MLGHLAGLRAFEIAKFHGGHITPAGIYVLGKGHRAETLPTHPLLWDLALEHPRAGYWFPSQRGGHLGSQSVTNDVTALFRSLGIAGSCHRARHTYGTRLLRGGANLRVVQELMRHSSLATTARYLGVDDDEKVAAIASLVA